MEADRQPLGSLRPGLPLTIYFTAYPEREARPIPLGSLRPGLPLTIYFTAYPEREARPIPQRMADMIRAKPGNMGVAT